MKILIIHNYYLQPGGEDQVIEAERAMLEHFGHRVVYYSRSNSEISSWHSLQKARFALKDIYWSKKTYLEIRQLIKKEKPDLAHIHNTFVTISPSAYSACYDENIPIVQTLHNYRLLCPTAVFYRNGEICEKCLENGRKAAVINRCWKNSFFLSYVLKKIVDKFLERGFIFEKVNQFIVLSEFSKAKYIQGGFPEKSLTVKPNFIEFDPEVSDGKGEYALFIGGFHSYKGIKTLLEIWPKLKRKYPLKVIGDGSLRRELEKGADGENVEFLGQKPLKEVMKYIKSSAFVIVPSECYENFPRVIVEAFACGVPVVASNVGAVTELVAHGKTGLIFKHKDANDFLAKIETLVEDRVLAQEMGKNARREYEEKFTMERNYKILMNIYEKALTSSA